METRRLRIRAEAIAEAREEFEWYRLRSAGAAERFRAELGRVLSLIQQSPQLFAPDARGVRRAPLRPFPLYVAYRLDDLPSGSATTDSSVIRIVAIAHEARSPGYWRGRLE